MVKCPSAIGNRFEKFVLGLFSAKGDANAAHRKSLSGLADTITDVESMAFKMRILPPRSHLKFRWDALVYICVLYSCLTTPPQLAFQLEGSNGWTALDVLVGFLLVVDIWISFRTGLLDESGEIILDKQLIKAQYMAKYFKIDFIGNFPFYSLVHLIMMAVGIAPSWVVWLKLTNFFRLPRMFRNRDASGTVGLTRIFVLLLGFMLLAHWVGCIFWLLGTSDAVNKSIEGDDKRSWIEKGKINTRGDDTQFLERYLGSFYWALTCMMKTPSVAPGPIPEKLFGSATIIFGAVTFAAILGNVTAMIASWNASSAQYRDKMRTLHAWSTKRKLPERLQKRIVYYVDSMWTITKGFSDATVISMLPPHLQGDMALAMHSNTLTACNFLVATTRDFRINFLKCLKPEVCMAHDAIVVQGNYIAEMYILMHGEMRIAGAGNRNGKTPKDRITKEGSLIGWQDPLLTVQTHHQTVKAVTRCNLHSITITELKQLVALHVTDADVVWRAVEAYLPPKKEVEEIEEEEEHLDDEQLEMRRMEESMDRLESRAASLNKQLEKSIVHMHSQVRALISAVEASENIKATTHSHNGWNSPQKNQQSGDAVRTPAGTNDYVTDITHPEGVGSMLVCESIDENIRQSFMNADDSTSNGEDSDDGLDE